MLMARHDTEAWGYYEHISKLQVYVIHFLLPHVHWKIFDKFYMTIDHLYLVLLAVE